MLNLLSLALRIFDGLFRVLYIKKIMSSANTGTFCFFVVLKWVHCFAYLIILARTSSVRMNRSGKSGYLSCFWSLEENFQSFTINYDVTCWFILGIAPLGEGMAVLSHWSHSLLSLIYLFFWFWKCWFFSWPRDWTWISRIVGRRFTIWATREALNGFQNPWNNYIIFFLYYTGMLYYINWFGYVLSKLSSMNKPHSYSV